jgi:RNA polymerase-binding transcription factor DksA
MINIDTAKQELLATKERLTKELGGVAEKDSENPGGYVGKEPEFMKEDNNVTGVVENASQQEEFSKNQAITNDLEIELADVNQALDMIDNGTYGVCTQCGKEIEAERLQAIAFATTCEEHMR